MDHFRPKPQYRNKQQLFADVSCDSTFQPRRRIGSFLPLLCPSLSRLFGGLNYFGPSGRLTVDVNVVAKLL